MRLQRGTLWLFRLAGIDVYLHWSWLVVAFIEIQFRKGDYSRPVWNALEYLALFGIVLLHEFGHALACRSVGGVANRIVLWPLGGVAFVSPPPRPGPVLWSIAAGPLVNVALVPVTLLAVWLFPGGAEGAASDLGHFCSALALANALLLGFNLLPIYPLDGGQILQALLWFVIGRAASLVVVSILGLVGAGLLFLWSGLNLASAAADNVFWLVFMAMAVFMALRSLSGLGLARALWRRQHAPRHEDLACPSCGSAPLKGEFWTCDRCHVHFDTFAEGAVCPWCNTRFEETTCPDCYRRHPIAAWSLSRPLKPGERGPWVGDGHTAQTFDP